MKVVRLGSLFIYRNVIIAIIIITNITIIIIIVKIIIFIMLLLIPTSTYKRRDFKGMLGLKIPYSGYVCSNSFLFTTRSMPDISIV